MILNICLFSVFTILIISLFVIMFLKSRNYVYPPNKCFDQEEMKKCLGNCSGKCKGNMVCNSNFSKDNLPRSCKDLKTIFDCSSLYGGGNCGCMWDGVDNICRSK